MQLEVGVMRRTTLVEHGLSRICTLGELDELVRSVEIRVNPCPILVSAFSSFLQFAFKSLAAEIANNGGQVGSLVPSDDNREPLQRKTG